MRSLRRYALLLAAAVVVLTLMLAAPVALADKSSCTQPGGPAFGPTHYGTKAYSIIDKLTRVKNPDGTYTKILRVAGTGDEVTAAEKVARWFRCAGYKPTTQTFTYTRKGVTYNSQNVIAVRRARHHRCGEVVPLVIVGAHYDAVSAGAGADDNASGVAVMLEVAERIARYRLPYDLMFVAFGAEEAGLKGSAAFVAQMAQQDIDRAIVMINYDSLIVGDKLYIHAGFNEKTWARDAMLRIIARYRLPIEMQPGLNPDYPAGLTPDGFSDYTAFNRAGIPIVAFESTNWEIGDLDGYEQTELYGSFWHTPNDTLETIEQMLPGRPMVRLRAYTELTFRFLERLRP